MSFTFLPQGLLFFPEEINTGTIRKYDLLFIIVITPPLADTFFLEQTLLPSARTPENSIFLNPCCKSDLDYTT